MVICPSNMFPPYLLASPLTVPYTELLGLPFLTSEPLYKLLLPRTPFPSIFPLAHFCFLQEVFSDTLFTPSPRLGWRPSRFPQYSSINHPDSGGTDNPSSSSQLPTPFYERDGNKGS